MSVPAGVPTKQSFVYSWSQVSQLPDEPSTFYLEHYIPTEGIVLLHGKYGTYKTPLTVCMAKAIALGEPLFGFETIQAAPILYIEMDSPRKVILPRLKDIGMEIPQGLADFAFCYPGFDIVNKIKSQDNFVTYSTLAEAHASRGYKVVFIDALRPLHNLSAEDSETPTLVYRACAQLFPGAVVVLIHHDRKTKPSPDVSGQEREEMDHESFSGSQAWANHATVAIKVEHANRKRREIRLVHHKSQAGPLQPPLLIRVAERANAFESGTQVKQAEVRKYLEALPASISNHDKDLAIAEHFACSTRTAQRRRLEIESVPPCQTGVAQDSGARNFKLIQ